MRYRIEITPRFEKEFKKLDRYTQKILKAWITRNIASCDNPRTHGKPLSANQSGRWRYRIGDYRMICEIQDAKLVILALTVGHRSTVYNQKN